MNATGHSASPGTRPERLHIYVWLLLVGLMVFLMVRELDSHPAIGSDSSRYVVLAQSLRSADTYGLISRPGVPASTKFPFGYPLILAPLLALIPGGFDVLRVPSLLATVLSAALIFWGWPLLSGRSYTWALAITALFCLSPLTILYGRLVLSEAVFTSLLLGSILLAEWGVRRQPPWWWYPLFGVVLTLMVFTRTVGWAMLVGIFLYMLWRRRRQALVLLAGTGLAMAVCVVGVVGLTPVRIPDLFPRSYIGQYGAQVAGRPGVGGAPAAFVQFLRQMAWQRVVQDAPSTILPGINSAFVLGQADRLGLRRLTDLVALATTGLLLLGLLRWVRREGLSAFLAAVLPYAVLLVAWNWNGPRMLYPVQSQIAYAFLLGLEAVLFGLSGVVSRNRKTEWRVKVIGAVVALMAIGYGLIDLRYPSNRAFAEASQKRAAWLRGNTLPSAIIMSSAPEIDYLYTGRKVVNYPAGLDASDTARLWTVMERKGVDVVVVAPLHSLWETDENGTERLFVSSEGENAVQAQLQALLTEGVLKLAYTSTGSGFSIYVVAGGDIARTPDPAAP